MSRQMHLNLFIHSRGHHEASWRHPASSPKSVFDISYYQEVAQKAEKGFFDSIFLADQLALGEDIANGPRTGLEPVTVLSALAVSTSKIGLIATASTTYTEPFNLARQFASLDHISSGRIGWNIVTSWLATAARNFGSDPQISHAERYELVSLCLPYSAFGIVGLPTRSLMIAKVVSMPNVIESAELTLKGSIMR